MGSINSGSYIFNTLLILLPFVHNLFIFEQKSLDKLWILFHQKWRKKILLPFVHNLFTIIFFAQKPVNPHQERIRGFFALDKNLLFTPIYFNLGKN